ncbi:MAG: gamma-glutamylcyclotransferase [Pseudomonadota bacterium]
MRDESGGFWVFGYGSLVWQPGFEFSQRQVARLYGFSRSFCMWSIHHRGTVDHPGLVLALDLDKTGHCDGVAFYVEPAKADETLAYLRERELISSAYVEETHTVHLRYDGPVTAYVYVVDREHEQYCQLSLEKQAQVISTAVGGRGPNPEYLYNVADHLRDLGLGDPDLDWLSQRVSEITS